jgi:hypothetical protein
MVCEALSTVLPVSLQAEDHPDQSIARTNRVNTSILSESSTSPSSCSFFDTFMELLVKDNLVYKCDCSKADEQVGDANHPLLQETLANIPPLTFALRAAKTFQQNHRISVSTRANA